MPNRICYIYALSTTVVENNFFPMFIGMIRREKEWAVNKDTDLVVRRVAKSENETNPSRCL
ncbi:hypothetical protein Smp_199180 [Schistosoma mansoni]|uniref:hypothetical protein n=1 Tax=Schistosoma mansoni TaxID=6183 RepID=UPI00022C8586|nr:hypothetical protein Smp_199180 [Schistosoma mansoni]|eukprot:XP_018647322.1 hypothetical protein Smp_199180 [Schistosoma mansoni]